MNDLRFFKDDFAKCWLEQYFRRRFNNKNSLHKIPMLLQNKMQILQGGKMTKRKVFLVSSQGFATKALVSPSFHKDRNTKGGQIKIEKNSLTKYIGKKLVVYVKTCKKKKTITI